MFIKKGDNFPITHFIESSEFDVEKSNELIEQAKQKISQEEKVNEERESK